MPWGKPAPQRRWQRGSSGRTLREDPTGARVRIYTAALDALAQGLGVSRSSILLFDPDGMMRFKAFRGLSDAYRKAVEGHTPWKPDTPDPQPIVVGDVTRDESLQPYLRTIQAEGIAAMAFIPLVSLNRVIGKFMLYYDVPHALGPDELQLAGVLVVDDQRDSRELLAAVFEGCGARVLQCESAARALDILESSPVRLVVADIAMPDVDGYDLVRTIRNRRHAVPAMAVSAYARPEDRSRALASGYDGYCAKPIETSDLLGLVAEVLQR